MSGRVPVIVAMALALTGCARGCTSGRPPIHVNPNMDEQPKLQAQEESAFFYDGAAMRPPVPGTVARGELRGDAPLETGKDAAGAFLAASPLPSSPAMLERGAQRYAIYCAPCHTETGSGKGILFERGKVPTADLNNEKVRAMPDGQLYDVITNGFGLMPGYRWPLSVADRWAIAAHVRRLQQERGAPAPAVVATAAGATP